MTYEFSCVFLAFLTFRNYALNNRFYINREKGADPGC